MDWCVELREGKVKENQHEVVSLEMLIQRTLIFNISRIQNAHLSDSEITGPGPLPAWITLH